MFPKDAASYPSDALSGHIIEEHKSHSKAVLGELASAINGIAELKKYPELCIFASGAFGRHEANANSGLDLFLVSTGDMDTQPIPRLSKIVIDAALIKIVQNLGLPPFSNDGEFLYIHYLEDILYKIGSPEDDYSGTFTARMSLLLESVAVYNEPEYRKVSDAFVSAYCYNYHYPVTPSPTFLIRDILKYWKGLHLNYFYLPRMNEEDLWYHICNLKLVFSKKIACYSFIFSVLALNMDLATDKICRIIQMSPLERLIELQQANGDVQNPIAEIITTYTWFLTLNDQSSDSLKAYLSDKKNLDELYYIGHVQLARPLLEIMQTLTREAPVTLAELLL